MEKFVLKNGKEVIIRPLCPDDYEAVNSYLDVFSTETVFTNQYPGRPKRTYDEFAKTCQVDHILNLGVFMETKVVGMCRIFIKMPAHLWLCYTAGFCIGLLREITGQGLGSHLMGIMEKWARDKGLNRIEGTVRSRNKKGIALYLKSGFEIEGLSRDKALINGEWHDEYIIGKILN